MKKSLSLLLCLLLIMPIHSVGMTASVSERDDGTGSRPKYVTVTSQRELIDALTEEEGERVFIQIGADIEGEQYYAFGPISVKGYKTVDLNGHTIRSKLFFNDASENRSLFVIEAGASLTLNDSVGGGEIIHDRFIPAMGETNAYSDIFLNRPLTVFDVYGVLTVNAGEITAGHYESEYYTYTDGYIYADSSPSPGNVNSITPGNAVVVKDGGRFVSNGGEYYGRGFTIDDNGDKEEACAALKLYAGAVADINAGDFYGKSCADVFSVDPCATIRVFAGNFFARYDNRITVDKTNGVAEYVNVDCGRIGIPLYAFNHEKKDYTHIYVDSTEHYYDFTDYSASDGAAFLNLGSSGTGIDVRVETMEGRGTEASPYLLTNAEDVGRLFNQSGSSTVYIRLMDNVENCIGNYSVNGNIRFDLNGYTIKEKLGFGDWHETYTMFMINRASHLTVEDSRGGGEIIFDRRIPSMGEMNEQTGIILDRALTVFNVQGTLTVNGGEVTAGHYESEYYTYTKKYNTGGSTSAGTVNSITPGCAVVVRDGGRFVANGGEYYGRGFTIDDNGEKDIVCSAVRLLGGAVAIINDGAFYGKSNADVFYVAWGANAYVYAGTFNAQYDNRITVDKTNGTAYYVNVDCGRIGLPLRAFCHAKADRCRIKVNDEVYAFSADFTSSQSNTFENLGTVGTGVTVTAEPYGNGVSKIEREDGSTAGLTYCPTDHFELINDGAGYFSDSFGELPESLRVLTYYWKVAKKSGSGWENVIFEYGTPVYNGGYLTTGNRLDLYDLARAISGGMEHDATYRITACADEYWRCGDVLLYSESNDVFELDCRYERLGNVALPDSQTGIEWPEHGKNPTNRIVEQDSLTATLTFEERSSGGTRYVPMSERSTFYRGGSYRLKVQIAPKQYYRADAENSVTVGGKTVTDITVNGGVLTGYIVPLDVLPSKITSVPVRGSLSDGVDLSAASPLNSPIAGVTVSTVWYKDGSVYTGTATPGEYRARVTVTTQDPYTFTSATVVKVMGKDYPITNLSADSLSGSVLTDAQYLGCTHANNTNGYTYDAENHYRVCSVCGAELIRGVHTLGSWVQHGGNDVRECTVCGYQESVSNGKSYAPYIRLTGGIPRIGDRLPSLAICDVDQKYGTLESDAEWYIDELNYTNYIPSDTVMEAGHVYYAQVKVHPNSGYYFDENTVIKTLNALASEIEISYVNQSFGQVVLKFTPRTESTVQFTLGTIAIGKAYRDFLSEFDALIDGNPVEFLMTIYKNNVYETGASYTRSTDTWWIASGNIDEFLARVIEENIEYKVIVTVFENDQYFEEDSISVLNPEAADTVETAGGDRICNVTAVYDPAAPVTTPCYGDFDGDGAPDADDLVLLRRMLLMGDSSNLMADINQDGKTDVADLVRLKKMIAKMI